MIKLSIQELCETADSLIAPVRLGVARPTAPFSLATTINEIIQGSEELFLVDPLAPQGNREPNVSGSNLVVSEPLPFLTEAVRRAAVAAASSRDLDDTNDGESKSP